MLAMIMVMDHNRLIGDNGGLPWHIPSELQYFKSVTMGKPMIMGRKTWESIGRPLPGRASIVVTSDKHYVAEGALVAGGLDEAIELAKNNPLDSPSVDDPEIMVIGGAALCSAAMPMTSRLYLTIVDGKFTGDTWLDSYSAAEWREVSREERLADGFQLTYLVLDRAVT